MPPTQRAEVPPGTNDTRLHAHLRISRPAVSCQARRGTGVMGGLGESLFISLGFRAWGNAGRSTGGGKERQVSGEGLEDRSLIYSLGGAGLISHHCLWHLGLELERGMGPMSERDHLTLTLTLTLPGNVCRML